MKCKKEQYCCEECSYNTSVLHKPWSETEFRELLQCWTNRTPHFLFCSQSWFPFGGYSNFLNNVFLLLIHDASLPSVNTGVWCAICATRSIGPLFVRRYIHTNMLHIIWHHFWKLVRLKEKWRTLWRNSATAHIANNSLRCLEDVFGERGISSCEPVRPQVVGHVKGYSVMTIWRKSFRIQQTFHVQWTKCLLNWCVAANVRKPSRTFFKYGESKRNAVFIAVHRAA
jgi:hypothetical protein